MAANNNTNVDKSVKKTKGLKDHKKLQKEKVKAKRAAAAQKAKTGHVAALTIFKEVAPTMEAAINLLTTNTTNKTCTVKNDPPTNNNTVARSTVDEADLVTTVVHNVAPACSTSEGIKVSLTVDRVGTPEDTCGSKHNTIDEVAHRKAIEAALYDNMETPMQMLARLNKLSPCIPMVADAEFHTNDEELDSRMLSDTADMDASAEADIFQALASNVFKIAVHTEPIDLLNVGRSMSVDQLFSMVAASGHSIVGQTTIDKSHVPQSIELPVDVPKATEASPTANKIALENLFSAAAQTPTGIIAAPKPVSFQTLLSAAAATKTGIIRAPDSQQAKQPLDSRTLDDSVTTEQRLQATIRSKIEESLSSLDPAVISCKVKPKTDTRPVTETPAPFFANYIVATNELKALLGIAPSPQQFSPISTPHMLYIRCSSPVREGFRTPSTHRSVSSAALCC
jgi:hypothetical protein